MGPLRARLLGGFDLRIGNRPLRNPASRVSRSVLAFLLLNSDRPHSRDLLAGTFWPDHSNAHARRRLSQSLWEIRRALAPAHLPVPFVVQLGDSVLLDPEARILVDHREFITELDHARQADTNFAQRDHLLEAVNLYRGDLLDGFYDDWIEQERQNTRHQFVLACRKLVDLLIGEGDYTRALTYAHRLVVIDPFDEAGHQLAMRLSVLMGDYGAAKRQYLTLSRLLRELGTTPSPQTTALSVAIAREQQLRPQIEVRFPEHPDETPLLVGRAAERRILQSRIDQTLLGQGGLVLIEGPHGFGKSRLLHQAVQDALWRGFEVAVGSWPQQGGGPYAAIREALRLTLTPLRRYQLSQTLPPAWMRELEYLTTRSRVPGQATPGLVVGFSQRPGMVEAVHRALEHLSQLGPFVLALDDLQWADPDSVQLLARWADAFRQTHLLILLAYQRLTAGRNPAMDSIVNRMLTQPWSTLLTLTPWVEAEVGAFLQVMGETTKISGVSTRTLVTATGGNPGLIIEKLQGRKARTSAASSPRPPELSPQAQHILQFLSAHQGSISAHEVSDASSIPTDTCLAALGELTQAGRVVSSSQGYSLARGENRTRQYGALPRTRRLDIHAALATTLARHRPDEPEIPARHFTLAAMPSEAAHYLEQAALRAMALGASQSAVQSFEEALHQLESASADTAEQYRVAACLEELLDLLGHRQQQDLVLSKMEALRTADVDADLLRRRSRWFADTDQLHRAVEAGQQSLRLAREAGDPAKTAAALSNLGLIACMSGQAAEGAAYLEEVVCLPGLSLRDHADARNALGQNLLDLQRFSEAETQLLAALAAYAELENPRGQAEVLGMLGTLRMERGESALALSALTKALDLSRTIAYRQGEALNALNRAILSATMGLPGAALLDFANAEAVYRSLDNQRGEALVLSNRAWLRHAVLGELEPAYLDVQTALHTYTASSDGRGRAQCLAILGSIEFAKGNREQADALFAESVILSREIGDHWIEAQAEIEWSRCWVGDGDADQAQRYATHACSLSEAKGMKALELEARALLIRSLVAKGEIRTALEQSSHLAVEADCAERPYSIALAQSLLCAAAGRTTEADAHLERAHRAVRAVLSDLSDDLRDIACHTVPEFRQIEDSWSRRAPRRVRTVVARADAPRGRRLLPDELLSVEWTIEEPDDARILNESARRRLRVARLVGEARNQGGAPTVSDLAAALGSSVSTIRRDLAALRAQGHLVQTRGNSLR